MSQKHYNRRNAGVEIANPQIKYGEREEDKKLSRAFEIARALNQGLKSVMM